MAVEQRDEEYGGRTLSRVLVLIFALMFVGLMAIPTIIEPRHFTPAGYVVSAIWLVLLLAGTIWCTKVRSTYRCPKCGAQLPALEAEPGSNFEHRFFCGSCDIIWTTGVHEGDS